MSSTTFFLPSPMEPRVFHPHPALSIASRVTLQSAGVGLLVSTVKNALDTHDKGAMGIFTRSGGTIAFFAAMGFTYSFIKASTSNVRESHEVHIDMGWLTTAWQTDDSLNGAAGGCAAGFLAGVRARSLPSAIGACAFLGTVIYSFDEAGQVDLPITISDKPSTAEGREAKRRSFFKEPKSRMEETPAPA
ncbi:MAG: hypothetical protein TREMPRED_003100 [Tremellales sp. Tagirdzhanova-0007]|nr:MAG: hypothetical protein TREMPRED_003100 [Tremellales sp. Tagirdzhanova-0007]